MKYKIMFDYGAYEGLKFQDEEFDDVNTAVQHALALRYSTPFIIVIVVPWTANYALADSDSSHATQLSPANSPNAKGEQ